MLRHTPFVVFLIACLLSTSLLAQDSLQRDLISPKVQQIAQKLADQGVVGHLGSPNFYKLTRTASHAELLALCEHDHPVVRFQAFWAWSLRDSLPVLPLVLAHLNDTQTVDIAIAGDTSHRLVGDLFITVVTTGKGGKSSSKLTEAQFQTLDSIVLLNAPYLEAYRTALQRIKPRPSLHQTVQAAAKNQYYPESMVALARYQNEADLPRLQTWFHITLELDSATHLMFEAIEAFPHEAFFPVVKRAIEKQLNEPHYPLNSLANATAAYQSTAALELLQRLRDKYRRKEYRSSGKLYPVLWALEKHHTPKYNGLLWLYWKDRHYPSPETLSMLAAENPKQARRLLQRDWKKLGSLERSPDWIYRNADGTSKLMVQCFLELGLKYNREKMLRHLRKRITKNNVPHAWYVTVLMVQNGDDDLLEILFDTLQTKVDEAVRARIIEALEANGDAGVKERVQELK